MLSKTLSTLVCGLLCIVMVLVPITAILGLLRLIGWLLWGC